MGSFPEMYLLIRFLLSCLKALNKITSSALFHYLCASTFTKCLRRKDGLGILRILCSELYGHD